MKIILRIALAALALAACADDSHQPGSTSSALEGSSAANDDCTSVDFTFDGALFTDLQKSLLPQYVHGDQVTVPKALSATFGSSNTGSDTFLVTVLGFSTYFQTDKTTGTKRSWARIGSNFPDDLGGDAAAIRLYDAMSVPANGDDTKVSKDGRFQCSMMSTKGGEVHFCDFFDVEETLIITNGPAHLCH